MPVNPAFLTTGADWRLPEISSPAESTPAEAAGGFGSMLSSALSDLTKTQVEAADGARALAAGEVEDPTAVVMAVERARLAMQLAGQIRTKAVDAVNDLLHVQV